MSDAEQAVICVSFDVDQLGGDLVWHVRDAQERNLYKHIGRFAGSVHLDQDDAIFVEVWGFGRLETFLTSHVLDAALVTLPHTSTAGFSPASPFSDHRAVHPLSDWTDTQYVDEPEKQLRQSVQTTVKPLMVTQQSGRWDLALVLTIALELRGLDGILREVRVFSFDPESEVGTGADTTVAGPPWRHRASPQR